MLVRRRRQAGRGLGEDQLRAGALGGGRPRSDLPANLEPNMTSTRKPRLAKASLPEISTVSTMAADQPTAVEGDTPAVAPKGKLGVMVALLRRPEGAMLDELTTATGWQAHSVRGAIAGAIKKKLKLRVSSGKSESGRVYRILEEAA